MMIRFFRSWFNVMLFCRFGGDSSSENTTQNTTTNVDKRMVTDGGSIGLSSDTSTVNVSMLDGGAIREAMATARANDASMAAGFSRLLDSSNRVLESSGNMVNRVLDSSGYMVNRVLDSSGNMVNQVLNSADLLSGRTFDQQGNLLESGNHLFDLAFGVLDKNAELIKASQTGVANAYETAKSLDKTAENKFLVTVGMAVVGLAAVAVMGKR